MNEIILDTETTGLSIKDDHRIIEIACIETQNLIPTKRFLTNLSILKETYPQRHLISIDTHMKY